MNNLSSFLEKFKNLIKDDTSLKSLIVLTIKNNTNLELKPENISLNGGNVFIKERPQVKNEIFMKKSKIITEINIGLKRKILDIK